MARTCVGRGRIIRKLTRILGIALRDFFLRKCQGRNMYQKGGLWVNEVRGC